MMEDLMYEDFFCQSEKYKKTIRRFGFKPSAPYRLDTLIYENAAKSAPADADLHVAICVLATKSLRWQRFFEKQNFLSEAQIKTYSPRILLREAVKAVADSCNVDIEWMSLRQDNANPKGYSYDKTFRYSCKTKKNVEFNPDFKQLVLDSKVLMKMEDMLNVNDGIPGMAYMQVLDVNCNIDIDKCLKKLVHVGDQLGYDYVTYEVQHHQTYSMYRLMFEGRSVKPIVEVPDELWHIAPLSVKDKILKNGLQPRASSSLHQHKLRHKPRVYMFNSNDDDMLDVFVSQLEHKDYFFDGKKLVDRGEYALFKIDTEKLDDVKFFIDSNTNWNGRQTAVWTYDNIPPGSIQFVKTFKKIQPKTSNGDK